jgi:dGTPase
MTGTRTRETLEALEESALAPVAAKSARSRGRAHSEPEDVHRTSWQRDRDRIVHSSAFRRLEYKTQVFVNTEGDYYRTRLTHSLEVSQIARSIARALGLNEDLVEALALAHDIGHPPFGHAGETALDEMMAGNGGFEHNVQALRIVDLLEVRYPQFRGLNLTFEIRESLLKGRGDVKALLGEAPHEGFRPLLEAQLVDWADSIAYDHHDLDDGLASQIFDENEPDLEAVSLFREARDAVISANAELSPKLRRHRIVSYLLNRAIKDFIAHSSRLIEESGVRSSDEARARREPLLGFSPETRGKLRELEGFLQKHFYGDFRLSRSQNKGKRFVRDLFQEYCREPSQLPPDFQAWARSQGKERAVCDYVAGMTDRFAEREHRSLFQPL